MADDHDEDHNHLTDDEIKDSAKEVVEYLQDEGVECTGDMMEILLHSMMYTVVSSGMPLDEIRENLKASFDAALADLPELHKLYISTLN